MCCESGERKSGFSDRRHAFGCNCGCGSSFRRFVSREEEQEWIEEYREQLKKELAGVEERLKELKGE